MRTHVPTATHTHVLLVTPVVVSIRNILYALCCVCVCVYGIPPVQPNTEYTS